MEEDAKAEDGFLTDLNTHLHRQRGGGGEEDPSNKKQSGMRERESTRTKWQTSKNNKI